MDLPATVRWLVSRQIGYREEEEQDEDEDGHDHSLPLQDSADINSLAGLSLHDSQFVGFNGRCNKRVDTCYAFWVGASLDVSASNLDVS